MLLEILVDAYCYQKGSIIFFEPIKEKNSQNKYIFDFRKDFIRNLMVGNFNLYFIFKNKDNKLIHIKNNKIESVLINKYQCVKENCFKKIYKGNRYIYIPTKTIVLIDENISSNVGIKFISKLLINYNQDTVDNGCYSFQIKLKKDIDVNPTFANILISSFNYHN
tara:strand:+ start:1577 stop:2071 length:495 start_codon:yes stop_codon:yes gene_type:complete